MGRKKVSELLVKELKDQLEKRGLDTKGNKASLVERLNQALETEGVNADDYLVGEMDNPSKDNKPTTASQGGDTAEAEGDDDVAESVTPYSSVSVIQFVDTTAKSATVKELKRDTEEDDNEEVGACDGDGVDVQREMTEICPNDVDKKKDDPEMDTVINTAVTTDDDHDALNLTIGEEEDRFMIDGEDQDITGTETKSAENPDNLSDTNESQLSKIKLADVTSAVFSTDSETKTPSSEINDIRVDSTQGKRNEKSDEGGKPHRKPKDDDRNTLLVTGLSSQTAATEIKAVFKKHGKIGGVKIMSNAKDPEGSRFALVAVMSSEDANICIKNLDGFELHGRIIHVDKARAEMLRADWVRKESSREHSKSKKDSSGKRSTTNGSSGPTLHLTKDVIIVEPSGPAPSDNTAETTDKDEQKKSTSPTPDEIEVIVVKAKTDDVPAAAESSSDVTTKDDVTPLPAKDKSVKKSHKDSHKKTTEKPLSTEKKEIRKDVIPFQRNYHFQKRPIQFRDNRMTRNPRFRYHEDNRDDARGDYHNRRYHDARGSLHPSTYQHHRMVRRSRSPPERIPFRRGSPEGRRSRQPELTFEEIYDTRQREKDREMERERREVERRRLEEEEKQQLLDEEFRRLAKERERIEAEKAELKRQKEKMIMEEREKQRLEQAEIEREKALLARKVKTNKRLHLEDDYGRDEQKKQVLDVRGRHSYVDSPLRLDKEKMRPHPYRREENARFSEQAGRNFSPLRGAPLRSAPVRDRRSPSWEKDRRTSKAGDRHNHREREPVKILRDERRDDLKVFPITTVASDSGVGRYAYDSPHYSSGILPTQGRIVTATTKPLDSYYSGGSSRDNRWPTASSSYSGGDTSMTSVRADSSWISSREPSWSSSERIQARTMTEMPERWGGSSSSGMGSTGQRMGIPAAPPPPIFSSPADELSLGSISGNSFNTGMYTSSYDYKIPSMPSHRR